MYLLNLQDIPLKSAYFFFKICFKISLQYLTSTCLIIYYSYFYTLSLYLLIKQDIRIYVPYGRRNGWTEWAELFLWTLMGSLGVTKANKI